jgi:SNF2 family DNA or RNA helicase
MLEEVLAEDEHALVFTQYAEMGRLLQSYLTETLDREVLFLHGGTPLAQRDHLVSLFQSDAGPPIFVLSLKAGGTGLNLTRANHVFHFDRWWNPAVENQATDRAFRIGQTRNVLVHKFVCRGTVEERIEDLLASKRDLSDAVLAGGEEVDLTGMTDEALLRLVALDLNAAIQD